MFSPGTLTCYSSALSAPHLQVTATDRDGPANSLLRYSIVSGDPLQQFSIHPRSGEITVRTALDREEVRLALKDTKPNQTHGEKPLFFPVFSPRQIPHYSLTVQAADEGDPPLSSAVLVTITVTDVNDNVPVFSQVSYSLLLQVRPPESLTKHSKNTPKPCNAARSLRS